jgi:hypothetical protein
MNKNKNYAKKKNYRGKGKSRDRKDPERVAAEEQIEKKEFNNDPSFYFGDPKLMDQAFSFSFNQFIRDGSVFETDALKQIPISSICRMWFNPSIGWAPNGNPSSAGINIAARKMYTRLSSMNAKTTNYLANDVATLLLALQSVIELVEYIRRAFGVVFLYNKRNWLYPAKVVEAMGIDPTDFNANLAAYRLEFNTVINMINQIAFPSDIPAFKKAHAMYSHIYVDSESPMAASYIFLPESIWQVDETSYDQGTVLRTTSVVPVDNSTQKMSVYIALLRNTIQKILDSATFNYIYADILRLVDAGNLLTLPFLDEGYFVAPEYDPMILLQINNAICLGHGSGGVFDPDENVTPQNDVYPSVDTGCLIYTPKLYHEAEARESFQGEIIVNFPHSMGDPDVTQRLEATRMIVLPDDRRLEASSRFIALPDLYMTAILLVGSGANWGGGTTLIKRAIQETDMHYVCQLSRFNEIFRIYFAKPDVSGVSDVFGDLDFYTTLTADLLKKANDLAYIHMYTPSFVGF